MIAPIQNFSNNGAGDLYVQRQLEVILQRKSLVSELKDSGMSLYRFAKERGMSVSTLWRRRQQVECGSIEALMDRRMRRAIRGSKVSNEVLQFVFSHMAQHPKTSRANIYRLLQERAEKDGWRIPSYPHLCTIIRSTPNDLRTILSENARVNWERWGLCARRENEFINSCWQMDATEMDVWCLDATTGELFKPWMSAAIDCYSRVVMAVLIHRKEPTSADSLRTLLNAVMPKNREDCPFYGLPQKVQRDNHQVYKSDDFMDTLLRLGIDMKERDIPNHCPSANGKIERFFRTFQQQFLVELNGYANQHHGLATAKQNAIPFPLMQKLAEKYLVKYHLRNHAGIQGISPWERWHENLSEAHGLIFNAAEIKENFKIRKEFTVRRDGIELEVGRHFTDPCLEGLVGEKVILRIPLDAHVDEVEVYHRETLIGTLHCIEENPSLADKINEAQLNRTIELQKFRAQMREVAPIPEYEEKAKVEREKIEAEKSAKTQETVAETKSVIDPLPHIQSLSSPMKKNKNGKNEQLLLDIPDFKTEDENE